MMTPHTQRSLWPPSSRRRTLGWDRRAARVSCVVLALVGVLPFVAAGIVGSSWVRGRVALETQRILSEQGIVADYSPSLRVWPLAVELDGVRIDANDGGTPA